MIFRLIFLFIVLFSRLVVALPPGTWVVVGPAVVQPHVITTYEVYRLAVGGKYQFAFRFSETGLVSNITCFEDGADFVVTYQNKLSQLKWIHANRHGNISSGYIAGGTHSQGRYFSPTELLTFDRSNSTLVVFDVPSRKSKSVATGLPKNLLDIHLGRPKDNEILLFAPNPGNRDLFLIKIDGQGNSNILNSWDFGGWMISGRKMLPNGFEFRNDRVWVTQQIANDIDIAYVELQASRTDWYGVTNGTLPARNNFHSIVGWESPSALLIHSGDDSATFHTSSQTLAVSQGRLSPAFITGQASPASMVYGVQPPRDEPQWKPSNLIGASQTAATFVLQSAGQTVLQTAPTTTMTNTLPSTPAITITSSAPAVADPVKDDPYADIDMVALLALLKEVGVSTLTDDVTNFQILDLIRKGHLKEKDLAELPDSVLIELGLRYTWGAIVAEGTAKKDALALAAALSLCKKKTENP